MDDRASTRIHRFWSLAKDAPGYDKADWVEFEAMILKLEKRVQKLEALAEKFIWEEGERYDY